MKVWGVVGAGADDLLDRLVSEFARRGVRVSAVKPVAGAFDVDREGKDSHRHRTAGATEVLLSSRKRWTLMREARDAETEPLEVLMARLAPVDLILVQGFEQELHPKIAAGEVDANTPMVRAVVARGAKSTEDRAAIDPDDIGSIADFIAKDLGL